MFKSYEKGLLIEVESSLIDVCVFPLLDLGCLESTLTTLHL